MTPALNKQGCLNINYFGNLKQERKFGALHETKKHMIPAIDKQGCLNMNYLRSLNRRENLERYTRLKST